MAINTLRDIISASIGAGVALLVGLSATCAVAEDVPVPPADADFSAEFDRALAEPWLTVDLVDSDAADGARPHERFSPVPFVDRAELVNVMRERRSVEFLRVWSNDNARVYFGVGPTGFAGLNLSPTVKPRKPKPRATSVDYSLLIEELTTAPATDADATSE
ncbi:MAG: hypothetical protein AAFZ58_11055 [Pseudomonadota bacterium]